MKATEDTNPFSSVIIINYNRRDLLARFLPSIERLDYKNYEVIIVDNASTDDSKEFIKKNYSQFKLIENPKNFGTAEGSNIGISHAQHGYILWLSNDMEVDRLLLQRMIAIAESSPDIGICTCKMMRMTPHGKKTDIIDSLGGDVDIFGFPLARYIDLTDTKQMNKPTEVFFSFGGAMLIKREVVDKIGGYDPSFFTLADDIDLCWRARLAGYRVVAQPEAVLYHQMSATLGTLYDRSRRRYWSERNTFRMLLKNYSTPTLARLLPLYLGLLTVEIIFFLFLRKFYMVKAYTRSVAWNIVNFKDTWNEHLRIQGIRVLSDVDIQKMMHKKPLKVTRILRRYLMTGNPEETSEY